MEVVHARLLEKTRWSTYRALHSKTVHDRFLCGVDWPRTPSGEIANDLERERYGLPEPPRSERFTFRSLRSSQRGRKHVTCPECLAAMDRYRRPSPTVLDAADELCREGRGE